MVQTMLLDWIIQIALDFEELLHWLVKHGVMETSPVPLCIFDCCLYFENSVAMHS
jgi:hypothetical protein